MTKCVSRVGLISLLLLSNSCGQSVPNGTTNDPDVSLSPGKPVTLSLNQSTSKQKSELDERLAETADLTVSEFLKSTSVTFSNIEYDPLSAEGLSLINASAFGLSENEQARLKKDGFVISTANEFPTFSYGYASIYAEDLPLYVSADSILYAVHRSYDDILKSIEIESVRPLLVDYLAELRARLSRANFSESLTNDLDVYLTVAESLLKDELLTSALSGNSPLVKSLFQKCKAAEGSEEVTLFDVKRQTDFSQCKPRGHYTDSEQLESYFRAMMWMGRIDFRLIETQSNASQVFHRRQLEAALALDELMTEKLHESHHKIDVLISAFVGEHDYMTVPQLAQLKDDLNIANIGDLEKFSNETLAQAIVSGGYGTQRISSHYMVNGTGTDTLPLSSSFALFGQRYVIDSHVFSNVVFDRANKGTVMRMMPDPLDVAYAALGNDQAGQLLKSELETYDYASDLSAMRTIADSEQADFWEKNLYNRWLGALRTLSPTSTLSPETLQALPAVAKTDTWGRRLLNTQLASWAELRHDTILYAKQSYTSGASCEFPDAYVEPYPEFFEKIRSYANHALAIFEEIEIPAPEGAKTHFERLQSATSILKEMAEHQRSGAPHSEEHLTFINQTVAVESVGCGDVMGVGWYPDLFYGDSLEWSPTVADVHTQPTDEGGGEVGKILHVGTGNARLMVTTVETCTGPRAYVGLVSSYFQFIEEDWKRLDDEEWEERLLESSQPPAPPWQAPLLP